MIGDDEKGDGCAEHVEDAVRPEPPPQSQPEAENSAAPSNTDKAVTVESRPQGDVAGLVPKELATNSVEITREATT